jgi:hypothetical protein
MRFEPLRRAGGTSGGADEAGGAGEERNQLNIAIPCHEIELTVLWVN